MTFRAARAAALLLLALPIGSASAAPKGASPSRLDYALGVSVRWGGEAGSEAFRAELQRSLESALIEKCFTRVVPWGDDAAAPDVDLLLTVTLSHVLDETLYDDTIAKALTPGEPTDELRRQAHFVVDVAGAILTCAGRVEVAAHRLHVDTVRRPVMIGEDPQAVARAHAIERIVGDLRKSLCGNAKNDRRIAEALSAEGEAPPAR